MKRRKRTPPVRFVSEEKGSTTWVHTYRRPTNGDPEQISHYGFRHETDARAFKAARQAARRDTDVICLTFERPPGVRAPKGDRPK